MKSIVSAPPADATRAALAALGRDLVRVATRDAGRLRGRYANLRRASAPDAAKLDQLRRDVAASIARCDARRAAKPVITIDQALPIAHHAETIIERIKTHQVLVLAGETGSGKTTQLPKLCLAAGRGEAGLVGCTQPRRLAARAVARRVAQELGSEVGGKVGFKVRFTDEVGDAALVKFMTDGILLAETQSDRWLSAYDTIILDEAHERSLNIDFLLGYLKTLLPRRPDLKLIITSATIDTARFAAHFDGAPVIEVEGRGFPVDIVWRPLDAEAERGLQQGSAEHVARVVDTISARDSQGDVLVFLPGEREIRDLHRVLAQRSYRHTEVLPLYARLSAREQDRVFQPGPARRIVLATNVAETSLTVPRIRYVVDTGTARVKRYSHRNQIERLHIEPIARAAADQRKGRCGRVGPGTCYRLYAEDDYAARPAFTDPELLRSSLANVILRMLVLKLGDVEAFPFLDAPDARAIGDGYRRLAEISAIDGARRLTAIGREISRWPIDVQLARMLVEARELEVLAPVLVVVAFLSLQDPRERPADARQQADQAHAAFADTKSDFVGVLKLWHAYVAAHEELTQAKLRDWCARHFLSYPRMREWRELHRQLKLGGEGGESGGGVFDALAAVAPEQSHDDRQRGASFEKLHRALMAGFPTQVARKDDKGIFRGTRERRLRIFPGSALAKAPPEWLFAAQILDLGGKVYAMLCARVEPAWIEAAAHHLTRVATRDPHWDRKRGQVLVVEEVSLFGLVLVGARKVALKPRDPAAAHAIFLHQGLALGAVDAKADFLRANARVLEEAEELEARRRQHDLVKDDVARAAFFEGKLPNDIADARGLDAWYRAAPAASRKALHWTLDDVLAAPDASDAGAFPSTIVANEQHFRLVYRFIPGDPADGVTLNLPLARLKLFPAARGEWLVPGMLGEKVAALIRALPKSLRRNFVPAPDFARAFIEACAPDETPLAEALARFLRRATGVDIDPGAFADVELPAHLLMRYWLYDEAGKTLAEGRDLDALIARWEGEAREAFSRRTEVEITREDIETWDFDEIPERIRSREKLDAWPALVDLGEAVALRVFERADEARAAHGKGVARLLRHALAGELKRARRQLPIDPTTALRFAPLGSLDALRDDLIEGAWRDALECHSLEIRSRASFDACRGELARALFPAAMARLEAAEAIITRHAELVPWLEPPLAGFARANYDDLETQRAALLGDHALRDLPLQRLAHLPRYLKAMRVRAERLKLDPARDQQRMLQVLPYLRDLDAAPPSPERAVLRWLIEEWRVQLFAQELKVAEPVSPKRLQRARDAALGVGGATAGNRG